MRPPTTRVLRVSIESRFDEDCATVVERRREEEEKEDEDEDLEERDAETRPGFSLIEKLLSGGRGASVAKDGPVALEIIGWIGGEVRTTALLKSCGDRRGPARLKGPREAIIEVPADAEVVTLDDLTPIPFETTGPGVPPKNRPHKLRRFRLTHGGALVKTQGAGWCFRFVPLRALPKTRERQQGETRIARAFSSAIALHGLVGALIGVASSGFRYEEPRELWAKMEETDIRDVEIKEPPPPEPEPEPEPAEEKQPEPQKTKSEPKSKKSAPTVVAKVKSKGILSALGKMTIVPPGKMSLVAAASNLNAVHVPGNGGFKIGALIAKSASSGINTGGGGGGKALTRGAASLIRDGKLVAGLQRSTGSVRGRVERASGRLIKAQGSISREEVAQVINAHIREVQYCYEKSLIGTTGLQGKLVVEWAIDENGDVSRVRQKLTTLPSPAVFDCISASLKKWQFPRAKGGAVIVSYPFIFNSVGF